MISSLNEQLRRIVLAGEICQETSFQFIEQITAFEAVDMNKPVTIYINSPGGEVYEALAMYDAMRSCRCQLYTVGIGKVMSAAVLLLAAGEAGCRSATKNSRIMIHSVSGGVYGSMDEVNTEVNEIKFLQNQYISVLSKESGIGKKELSKLMSDTTYMTADAAMKFGIIDVVIPFKKKISSLSEE